MTTQAVWLLLGLLFAHYLGDFTPLATTRMHRAKANGAPVRPIAEHAAIHSILVGLVVALVATPSWLLIAGVLGIEFLTHLAIDLTRGRLGRRLPSLADPGRSPYWYALGVDQLAHGVVLIGLAALVL